MRIDAAMDIIEGAIRMMLVAKAERMSSGYMLDKNKFGLFQWPPVWLCSQEQWISRFHMTKGKKSFRRLGGMGKKLTRPFLSEKTADQSEQPPK